MSTTAPVTDNRKDFTIVNGPSRKQLDTIQVSLDIASDAGITAASGDCNVHFELRDWGFNGIKSKATGQKIRRRVVVTKIDRTGSEHDELFDIEGIMARGRKMRCFYNPRKREGELYVEGGKMY